MDLTPLCFNLAEIIAIQTIEKMSPCGTSSSPRGTYSSRRHVSVMSQKAMLEDRQHICYSSTRDLRRGRCRIRLRRIETAASTRRKRRRRVPLSLSLSISVSLTVPISSSYQPSSTLYRSQLSLRNHLLSLRRSSVSSFVSYSFSSRSQRCSAAKADTSSVPIDKDADDTEENEEVEEDEEEDYEDEDEDYEDEDEDYEDDDQDNEDEEEDASQVSPNADRTSSSSNKNEKTDSRGSIFRFKRNSEKDSIIYNDPYNRPIRRGGIMKFLGMGKWRDEYFEDSFSEPSPASWFEDSDAVERIERDGPRDVEDLRIRSKTMKQKEWLKVMPIEDQLTVDMLLKVSRHYCLRNIFIAIKFILNYHYCLNCY